MRAPSPVVAHGAALGVALRAALSIEGVVLQAAEHTRAIDLGSDILPPRLIAASAAIDGGLFAALHDAQHVADQVVLVEAFERGQDPVTVTLMREKCRGKGWFDVGALRRVDAQPALDLDAG